MNRETLLWLELDPVRGLFGWTGNLSASSARKTLMLCHSSIHYSWPIDSLHLSMTWLTYPFCCFQVPTLQCLFHPHHHHQIGPSSGVQGVLSKSWTEDGSLIWCPGGKLQVLDWGWGLCQTLFEFLLNCYLSTCSLTVLLRITIVHLHSCFPSLSFEVLQRKLPWNRGQQSLH